MRRGWLLGMALVVLAGTHAAAEQSRYAGRPLADVLGELSRSGLALVYSSRVVLPDLVVLAEPASTLPRRVLDEILAPHGLRVEAGAKGRLLIVRVGLPAPPSVAAKPERVTTGTISVSLRARDSAGSIRASSVELTSEDGAASVLDDGRVLVTGLADGPRFLEAAAPGYLAAPARAAAVKAALTLDVVIDLDRAPGVVPPPAVPVTLVITRGVDYQETVVVSERRPQTASGPASVVTTPDDLLQGAGHAGNLYAAMHALPGVKSGHEFDNRLVVRGGAPDQNLVVVDGVEIHAPYHLFGLASTILSSAVESVAWSAGGFDARHGDRLSSVLSIRTRDGSAASRIGGEVGAGFFDSDFIVEGPVAGVRGASWLAAGRYSFYDLTASALLGFGFPAFQDVHAKVTWAGRPDRRAWLQGMFGRERTDYVEHDDPGERWNMRTRNRTLLASTGVEADLGTRAQVRGVASVYRLADGMEIVGAMATDARAALGEQVPDGRLADVDFNRATAVEDWAARQELSVFPSEHQSIEAGVEAHRVRTRWRWTIDGDRSDGLANRSLPWPYGLPGSSLPSTLDSARDDTRVGAFIQYAVAAGRTSSQVGVRADHSSLTGDVTVSPRGSVTLAAGDRTRVSLSAGLYRQSPGYEKLLLADRFVDLSETTTLGSERAVHAAVAVERNLARGVTARVEAYRKVYAGLVVGRLETEGERQARLARYDFGALAAAAPDDLQITSHPVNGGRGHASGVDVLVTKHAASGDPRLSGWIAYSYTVARQEVYGVVRPADYDRPHAIAGVAQYRISPTLALSGTLRIASGAPWTPPVGVRAAAAPDLEDRDGDGDRAEWVPARDSTGQIVYTHAFGGWSNVNSARLPVYARLDARVTFSPGGAAGRWMVYVDVVNLLNRTNAGLIACRVSGTTARAIPAIERTSDMSVPFLPSFGFRYRF